jgi:DNA-binding XRE family transcriptional regulator
MAAKRQTTFTDGSDRIDRLVSRPDLAPRIAEIRERMHQADDAHAMTLAMVRNAAGLTQQDVAERMNVTQGAVARTERRGDVLLSTLRSYLTAAGAREVRIVVVLADGSIAEIALAELQGGDQPESDAPEAAAAS